MEINRNQITDRLYRSGARTTRVVIAFLQNKSPSLIPLVLFATHDIDYFQ